MPTEGFKRKLTAILSADVAGYSRLMRDDEEATVRTLNAYKEMIFILIERNQGRIVDSTGDNLLAECGSVVDAVRCAVQIQEDLKAKNEDLDENRKMEFRIGINLGDVIQEGNRIYGDGVNVAARIESLADAGGICISRSVYNQVKRKLNLKYEDIGDHQVKNIDEPVRVYKVLMESGSEGFPEKKSTITPASVDRMAYSLPDKPSIAVLPFTNMSGDASMDYIGDGLSENIISALSVSSKIFVIARNSTFTYKGKPIKVQHVAEDLGVRYVLEGSIQKSGVRLRVTAQLIDALTGHHLWSEKYDRKMADLFDLQDEITKKIVVNLHVELTEGEHIRVFAKSTDNLEAWNYYIKGLELFWKFNEEDNLKAREHFEAATKLDPKFVTAFVLQSATYRIDAMSGWSDSPAKSFERAFELAQIGLSIDEQDAFAHAMLGGIYLFQGQYEKAITEGKRAITLNPNFGIGHAWLAHTMFSYAQFDEALTLLKKAYRLDPNLPPVWLTTLSRIHVHLGRYEEALEACNRMGKHTRSGGLPMWMPPLQLSLVYQEIGREEEARAYMAEAIKAKPDLSLEAIMISHPFRNPIHLQREIDAYRKAGMPEKPPRPVP